MKKAILRAEFLFQGSSTGSLSFFICFI